MNLCQIYGTYSLHILLEWLTFGADHIHDGGERMTQNIKFSYGLFPKRRKRRPLVNYGDYRAWLLISTCLSSPLVISIRPVTCTSVMTHYICWY